MRLRPSLRVLLSTTAFLLLACGLPGVALAAPDLELYANVYTDDGEYNSSARGGTPMRAGFDVSNYGADDATGVEVEITLPAGATYTPEADSGLPCTPAGQVITCSVPDVTVYDWESGAPVRFLAPAGAGSHAVTMHVSSIEVDEYPDSNDATRSFDVIGANDVDFGIYGWAYSTDDTSEIRATRLFELRTFTYDALGLGIPDGTTATVSITLPPGLSFASTPFPEAPAGASCSASGSVGSCTFVPTFVDYREVVVAHLVAATDGAYTALMTVSTNKVDTDADSDTATRYILVHPAPPAVDLCSNIDGAQSSIPAGMVAVGSGTCSVGTVVRNEVATDACANVDGIQAGLPPGSGFDPLGRCIRPGALRDVLRGGAGTDVLSSGRGNDWLRGGGGNDKLNGGVGNDRLEGEAGADLLDGAAGADVLLGGAGIDKLTGGLGNDKLDGGLGADAFFGGAGNDSINARDRRGRERISCGAGRDTVLADRTDLTARDCEVVKRR